MDFEWDPAKAAANLQRHGVTFEEATTAFLDPNALTVYDELHSDDEDRYLTIGHSQRGRLLIISHTDRDGAIRIISVRKPTRREENVYNDRR